MGEARKFAQRNAGWLEAQLLKQALNPPARKAWLGGTSILFRGKECQLQLEETGAGRALVRFDTESVRAKEAHGDLRECIERHLWSMAAAELPRRVSELAMLHGVEVRRVTVRNQSSRWGSCSRRGTISLNWRLIQAPAEVRDYIILHELAHLKEMNHSPRFWQEVKRLCPAYAEAEAWLKSQARLLWSERSL